MSIAKNIETILTKSSWIRKMFEEGARLKALHGAENVFDFSLGNPNLKPPAAFKKALSQIVEDVAGLDHGYMPNAGYPHVRQAVADFVAKDQGVSLAGDHIIMTCGAAGALNVTLKSILDPGDEVLVPTPFFVEYTFYAQNHGGRLQTVATRPDFTLDLDAIERAITPQTKAFLINAPNNPTGQIYSPESLDELGRLLAAKSTQYGRTIYLISDEPYRKIIYDGNVVPSILNSYQESIIATSYSKDLSIPGERIGYIAVNPEAQACAALINAMTLANRILGFVNAPALMQRILPQLQGAFVDVDAYKRKRDLLCEGLRNAGYQFVTPPGAFYLFPKSPISDDVEFVRALQEERILTVPGSGFGGPGHFRIAFCVEDHIIEQALPAFASVRAKFK